MDTSGNRDERETRPIRCRRGPAPTMAALAALLTAACSRSNNLLLGRVQGDLGSHHVTVTDCYRWKVPPPHMGGAAEEWAPCRDAVVRIAAESLTVNGQAYGRLAPGAPVLVDHGVVSVESARD